MTDILPFLKSLISLPGLTGYETPVTDLLAARWQDSAHEIHRSRLGSLHALRRGSGRANPSLVVSAHVDAIGLMVAGFVDGFLRIDPVGTLDPRILAYQPVTVHAHAGRDLPGVIVPVPPVLRADEDKDKKETAGYDDLLVELGLPARRVTQLVRPGDLISFASEPTELLGSKLSGHSLDNRASLAALTLALESLPGTSHAWDVWFVATVQEETSFAGAATSAHALNPDMALILDVTYGKGPGSHSWETFPLGGGPTIGIGPEMHPFLVKRLKRVADELSIPVAFEPIPELSSTETDAFQLSRHGIPTALIEIPLRNMHTPVEVVALDDITRAARLISGFIASLESDFLQRIAWDD
jgi:endoglucanase